MSRSRAFVLLAASSLFLGATSNAFAQSVWHVDDDGGPGIDSTTIMGAISAAADGDLVLVHDGSYAELVTVRAKGLSIVAAEGASVVQSGQDFLQGNGNSGFLVEDLAAGQAVYIRGLVIQSSGGFEAGHQLLVRNNLGPVWVEDCTIGQAPVGVGHDGISILDSADVTLARVSVQPGGNGNCPSVGASPCGNGVVARRSSVYGFDCSMTGVSSLVPSVFSQVYAGTGVVVEDGEFYASGSMAQGGSGVFVNCQFVRNGGGAGLFASGTAAVTSLDSEFHGGVGAHSGGLCSNGPDGPDTSVSGGASLTFFPGTARHFSASSPNGPGADLQLDYQGLPGDLVFLGYNAGPGGIGLFTPQFGGYILTFTPAAPIVLFHGVTAGDGSLQVIVPGGPITISSPFEVFLSQPIFFDGTLTVGAPSQIVLLGT